MKRIKVISFLCLMAQFSCTDDLYQDPITSKVAAKFYSTEIEIEEAVNGAYDGLQSNGLYGLNMVALGEIPSDATYDEVPLNDDGTFGKLDNFSVTSIVGSISETWRDSYKTIQRANVVLSRIEKIPFKVAAVRDNRIGEMKFIRALLYFNLVRLYGDVPLVTQETTDPNSYLGQGRTSAKIVYEQIIKDLTEAETLLPVKADKPGKVIKTAAQALLGKIYLTLNDLQNAKIWLLKVKDSNIHDLVPIADVFDINKETNKEILFSVQFASGINGNSEGSSMQQIFSPSGTISGAKGHNLPTKNLYSMYTVADSRKGKYVAITASGVPFSLKLTKSNTVPADGGSNVVVIRYADIILMLAEIENEQGNIALAKTYLNLIRTRAGLANTTAANQVDMRSAIDLERKLELVGEGDRWFDLLRKGTAITVMNQWFKSEGILITIDSHNLLMPIPLTEINTDPAMKQNPGY
ncbi:RagB/SusD family nutrient uptake outer membrane protein [Flavobacterium sp. N502540]|uniref:RagB/SusD family nutrient uptake outer membrane protein n=1 Tax=Flavobacterium sp. N502540 TaxID=2986838 RepID=UPI002223FF8F|nr:RagB/SusD family nutrient uptake outer membrane protein [Flavobacterium sp. N502540]